MSELIAELFSDEIRAVADGIEVATLHKDGSVTPDGDPPAVCFKSEDISTDAERGWMLEAAAADLQWLHSSSAGINAGFYQQLQQLEVRFSHSPGIHAKPMAEWVLGHMLHFAQRFDDFRAYQAEHRWQHSAIEELRGRTVGIVGYGGIGKAVAELTRAFGMRNIATRRTHVEGDPHLDEWLPVDRLDELIARSDYLVICAPLTEETRGMISGERLALLKPSAVLVNVGRGPIIDEPALVEALRAGRIRGAALDVFASEPLPADSPLWDLPNCLVSPHSSGESDQTPRRTTELFIEQLRRYLDGESLLNEVATAAG